MAISLKEEAFDTYGFYAAGNQIPSGSGARTEGQKESRCFRRIAER